MESTDKIAELLADAIRQMKIVVSDNRTHIQIRQGREVARIPIADNNTPRLARYR
jgi:hypothetical protein